MHIQQIWHPESVSAQELLHAVYYSALEPETQTILRSYVTDYHEPDRLAAPAKCYDGRLSGGAYHHGGDFIIYVKGWPEDILHQCIMSEGDRERATLEYLHLQTLGLTAIGFGQGRTKDADTVPKLTFLGFLGVKP